MKKVLINLILIFSYCLQNYVSAQQDASTFSNSNSKFYIGLANQLFTFKGKSFNTIGPAIEFQLFKHFYIQSKYERFRNSHLEDISKVRDGQPRVISKNNTFQHIPLTLKYCFIDKQKIDYYLKISMINQFRKNITSTYIINNSAETNKRNDYNVLYGFSVGYGFLVCERSKVGLEAFFKNGKNIYSEIFGVNINYMFNLNN